MTKLVELPNWHSKAEGSVALPSGAVKHSVCVHRAQTQPSNKERAPTREPALSKRKSETTLVSRFLPVLAGRAGVFFLISGRWFSCRVPAGSRRCFCLLFWPWASCSSSRREGRRVKRKGTDPRTSLFRYPPLRRRLKPGVRPQRCLCPDWRSVRGGVRVQPQ